MARKKATPEPEPASTPIMAMADGTGESVIMAGLVAENNRLKDLLALQSKAQTYRTTRFELSSTDAGWVVMVTDPKGTPEGVVAPASMILGALLAMMSRMGIGDPKGVTPASVMGEVIQLFDHADYTNKTVVEYEDRMKMPMIMKRGKGREYTCELRQTRLDGDLYLLTADAEWEKMPDATVVGSDEMQAFAKRTEFPNPVAARAAYAARLAKQGFP